MLEQIVVDLHWMARRYANGRRSYVVSLFNQHTQTLLDMGIKLNQTADESLFARDGMGPRFEGRRGTPEQLELL